MVVVVDSSNHRLSFWRLRDGTVWKHIGSQGTASGQFTDPYAIALTSSGALVVTDERRVQVLTVEGAVLCVLDPTAVVGVGQLGGYLPGVAVCPGTDEILVTDYNKQRVVALLWNPTSEVRLFFIIFFIFCFLFFQFFIYLEDFVCFLLSLFSFFFLLFDRLPATRQWRLVRGAARVISWDSSMVPRVS